jgi:sensor c-di-GMP phosphodiesterase-like protein
MVLFPKKRAWIAVTALLLAVSLGSLAGYMLGRAEVLRSAEARLAQDAAYMDEMLSSLVIESQDLMTAINASKFAFCSDEEIAWFRRLMYHSINLRDAGRIRDGRIQCSAVYGRDNLPSQRLQPSYTYLDGTSVYVDLPPYRIPGNPVYARKKGDAFVVEDPNFSVRFNQLRRDHGFTNTASPLQPNGYPVGFYPKVPGVIANRDAQGQLGDTLYATRCSPRGLDCVVSYGSVSSSLDSAFGLLALQSALGGLSGGFLVLAFLVVYQRNQTMRSQLRRAIRTGKLRLVYQPIVDLSNGRTVGAEALARWTDEDGFAVSPLVFVHIAEEQGFVGELTEFVVRQALRDFGNLLHGQDDFRLSVNVTAFDMGDSGFLPMLDRTLGEAGVEPRWLAIELTESATANTRVAIETIRQLRLRGHCVEIDDFGTGYSSLAYLKDLSVDAIKIDKAFTQAISTEAVIGEILPQILSLAAALELEVIVEGIETEEQAAFFAALARPVLGQGWYLGRPVPAPEFQRAFLGHKMADQGTSE